METIQNKEKKRNKKTMLLVTLVLLVILVLLFLFSPLRSLIFPSNAEPSLSLVVVESTGPDPATGFYRVLVEAIAEGRPEPQISYNRNDAVGEVEANHTLLLLAEDETFLLKALATNSQGTAETELELFAGIMPGVYSGRVGPTDPSGADRGGDAAPGTGENGDDFEDEEDEDKDEDAVAPPPPGGGGSDNQAPLITEIYRGSDMVYLHEEYPLCYRNELHTFTVLIEDADFDEITLEVQAAHGRVQNIRNLPFRPPTVPENVRIIDFDWISPANPAGNRNRLSVPITITARDPAGASDRKVIDALLIVDHWLCDDRGEESEPAPPPPPPLPASETIEISLLGNNALSGSVISNGLTINPHVVVGDNSRNEQAKGYLTFDLDSVYTEIGRRRYEVASVRLNIRNIERRGSPEIMASNIDFKVFYYGTVLDASAFRVGGTRFYITGTGEFYDPAVVNISSATLGSEVSSALATNRPRFQIKIGLDRATDNDGVQDTYSFYPTSAELFLRLVVHNE